ncbi:hypothetical protein NDQ86_05155 [Salinispora arenicola]|nr:hypothetical protein [Salinispora arenicola]
MSGGLDAHSGGGGRCGAKGGSADEGAACAECSSDGSGEECFAGELPGGFVVGVEAVGDQGGDGAADESSGGRTPDGSHAPTRGRTGSADDNACGDAGC